MKTIKHPEGHEGKNVRPFWIVGLAALGLVLAAPVQAAPNFRDGAFIVAGRDQGNEASRPDRRDDRKDTRDASKREGEREEPKGYGYGYERRQQQQPNEDGRPRDRR